MTADVEQRVREEALVAELSPESQALVEQLGRRRLASLLRDQLGEDVQRARGRELVTDASRELEALVGDLLRAFVGLAHVRAAGHQEPRDLGERRGLETNVLELPRQGEALLEERLRIDIVPLAERRVPRGEESLGAHGGRH